MLNKKAYNEFQDKLYLLLNGKHLPEKQVSALFDELLTFLPNGGKLYKYKSLESFHIDELEKKYVWFSSAEYLNDNKDCTFNVNGGHETAELVKYFLKDNNYRKAVAHSFYMSISRSYPNISNEIIDDCFDSIEKNGKRISKLRFDNVCQKYGLNKTEREQLWNKITTLSDKRIDEDFIRGSVANLSSQSIKIRESMKICSLTTSYKKDSMWAYYCNNRGICIEYDFSKINTYGGKGIFLNTQKVLYKKKRKFSYVDIIKAKLENSTESLCKADKLIMEQLLTKDKSWSTEEEWRVILNDTKEHKGLRVFVDMISSIYIDYSVLEDDKSKKIIKLAEANGWNVYVRYFCQLEAEYRYETIEDTNKLIEKISTITNRG